MPAGKIWWRRLGTGTLVAQVGSLKIGSVAHLHLMKQHRWHLFIVDSHFAPKLRLMGDVSSRGRAKLALERAWARFLAKLDDGAL